MEDSPASSGDEAFVVHKRRSHFASHQLSGSDDDSPPHTAAANSDDTLESPDGTTIHSTEKEEVSNSGNKNTEPSEDNHDADKHLVTKENKSRRKRIIRALSESDDEQPNSMFFAKSTETCSERLHRVVDSDSDSDCKIKNKSTRIQKRREKMSQKMKKRFQTKEKHTKDLVQNNLIEIPSPLCDNHSSVDSEDDQSLLSGYVNKKMGHKKGFENEEKQSLLENNDFLKPLSSLCDNDSSTDCEDGPDNQKSLDDVVMENIARHQHKEEKRKTIKVIADAPKPKRMSVKEAMENMTKIKSESNRMLREKRVLLPYHRPKQVALKDILSRKKALPDLPLRMNQEQLKQYALQLEESQKEMMELYKSDEEEQEDDDEVNLNDVTLTKPDNITPFPEGTDRNLCQENGEQPTTLITPLEISNTDIQNIEMCEAAVENNNDKVKSIIENIQEVVVSDNTDNKKSELVAIGIESLNIENVVSSERYTYIDSQLISLHFNSENTEVDKNETSANYTKQDTKILSVEENPGKIIEDNPDNGFTALNEIENRANVCRKKITADCKLDLNLENEKEVNNEEFSLILNTSNSTSEGEKQKPNKNLTETENSTFEDDFPDDDIDMSHFEELMENIEKRKELKDNSPMLIKDVKSIKPHLSGAPGMVIDLDESSAVVQNKKSGVELLKQRYMYFSKIKTPEEENRAKDKRMKPGAKHLLLKNELEKQISEQSIAEWTKRLEEERLQQLEMKALNGELSDCDDVLDDIDKECDEKTEQGDKIDVIDEGIGHEEGDDETEEEDGEQEEEEKEDTEERRPKKSKSNPLIDDEAEVENDENAGVDDNDNEEEYEGADDQDESDSSDEDSSSEDDNVTDTKPKKGRIIKAFEDSDDEEPNKDSNVPSIIEEQALIKHETSSIIIRKRTSDLFESQTTDADEEISLAQPNRSNSEDINVSFTDDPVSKGFNGLTTQQEHVEKLLFNTQTNTEDDMEAIVDMCSGKFPSKTLPDPPFITDPISSLISGPISTQVIGEDILQMCSGKFSGHTVDTQMLGNDKFEETFNMQTQPIKDTPAITSKSNVNILCDELNDPELDLPKTNKFFGANINGNIATLVPDKDNNSKLLQKGKLVIESSDEEAEEKTKTKKNKLKRKKPDQRALVISDDEEEESEEELSEVEDEDLAEDNEEERLVEYDSEENEVEVPRAGEARRRANEFVEREAELSSEDEWAGSGDEDERGLDRLEREAGDDDVFHQGRLQRELGQMHMQDQMDQDRREVRMLQEILLEDGDLTGGSRQRRFRWKDAGEADEPGTVPDGFGDTEEERESEEQWRKQRHERQLFLRQLAEQKSDDDILGLGLASSVKAPVVQGGGAPEERTGAAEKNPSAKDLPSPVKNAFTIMQQQYRAVLSGGAGGALRRLAAAVAPEERALSKPAPGGPRSFVFASRDAPAPQDDEPVKKTKRKAEAAVGTPKLIKKLRLEEQPRKSILQQLDT